MQSPPQDPPDPDPLGPAPLGEDDALTALGLPFDAELLERQLARQLAAAVVAPGGLEGAMGPEGGVPTGARTLAAAGAVFKAARPEDDLEAVLAAGLAAAQGAAMACFARATEAAAETAEFGDPAARERDGQLRLAARFTGLTTRQVNALTRCRAERRRARQAQETAAVREQRAQDKATKQAKEKAKTEPAAPGGYRWVWDGGLGRERPWHPVYDAVLEGPEPWRATAERDAKLRARLAAERDSQAAPGAESGDETGGAGDTPDHGPDHAAADNGWDPAQAPDASDPDLPCGGVLEVPMTLAPEEIGQAMVRSLERNERRRKAIAAGRPVAPEDEEQPEDDAPCWITPEERKAWIARRDLGGGPDSEAGGFLVVPAGKLTMEESNRMNRPYQIALENTPSLPDEDDTKAA